jgi:hypothetical protein
MLARNHTIESWNRENEIKLYKDLHLDREWEHQREQWSDNFWLPLTCCSVIDSCIGLLP